MILQRRRFLYLAAGAAALPTLGTTARAQSYPAHPVRVIVPFSAGGPTDVFARIIAGNLSRNLGQQFYVENQPGAGGNLGMGAGARATPDGYAITIVSTSYVVNPSLYVKTPYDPLQGLCTRHFGGGDPQRIAGAPVDPRKERHRTDRVSQSQ